MNPLACRLLTATFLLTFAAGSFAQEKPKAELLDEFGSLHCEDILARVDWLGTKIHEQPAATASIVIYRPAAHPSHAEKRRRLISSTLQRRGLERDRFRFFLEEKSPDGYIRTQLWMVPPGAELTVDGARAWDEPSPNVSRPFQFGYSDEMEICPTYVPRAFADLLLANPGSIGRIIVRVGEDAIVERFSFAKQWIDELVEKHGVPRKRLRLIFRNGKGETGAEFWFIPSKHSRARLSENTASFSSNLGALTTFTGPEAPLVAANFNAHLRRKLPRRQQLK